MTESTSLTLQWPTEEQVQLRSNNENLYHITAPTSRQFRVGNFFSEKNSKVQTNPDLSLSEKINPISVQNLAIDDTLVFCSSSCIELPDQGI